MNYLIFYSGPPLLTTDHCSFFFFLVFFNQIAFNSKKRKKRKLKHENIGPLDFVDFFALFNKHWGLKSQKFKHSEAQPKSATEPSYSNENLSFKWEMPYLSHP